jgi:hypothetical protein
MTVLTAMNSTTSVVLVGSEVFVREVTKETVVYDAPITEVIAAAQSTTPNARSPNSPAACWNAEAVGFRALSGVLWPAVGLSCRRRVVVPRGVVGFDRRFVGGFDMAVAPGLRRCCRVVLRGCEWLIGRVQ